MLIQVNKLTFQTINSGYICSMQVDDALIDKLSRLAMLKFDKAEKEELKSDLQKMIGFVDKLKELDTTGIAPLLHMSGNVNVLREDTPGNMLSREEALSNAPLHDDHFFKVPKVIKKTEQS
jgi:aspartyl-tRNA(Asn)/glutamyl-tRNA(Gln) amidotransferase subunit C